MKLAIDALKWQIQWRKDSINNAKILLKKNPTEDIKTKSHKDRIKQCKKQIIQLTKAIKVLKEEVKE